MNSMTTLMRPRVAAIRSEDEAPLRDLVAAIAQAHRNALVVCEDDMVLDAIGVQIARALRRQSSLQLELYQPSSTEQLLARFNGMLTDLPLHAAQAVLQPHERLRVWVLHLTEPRELADVQLLLRLVQGFPGAGVRLLLLLSQEVARDRAMVGLGPRVYRWEVESLQASEPPQQLEACFTTAVRADGVAANESDREVEKSSFDRLAERAKTRLNFSRLMPSGSQRWLMGVFGLALAASGGAAAWWHAKPTAGAAGGTSASRPVPEILEIVDSRAALRPGAKSVNIAP